MPMATRNGNGRTVSWVIAAVGVMVGALSLGWKFGSDHVNARVEPIMQRVNHNEACIERLEDRTIDGLDRINQRLSRIEGALGVRGDE